MEDEQRLRIKQAESTTQIYFNDAESPIELKEGDEINLLLNNSEVSLQIPLPTQYISAEETLNQEMPAVYRHIDTGVTFDLDMQKINFDNKTEKKLTHSESEIMKLMLESPRNMLLIKDYADYAENIKENGLTAKEAKDNLKVFVRRIRKKIEEGGVEDQVIETIRGKGYCISGSINKLFEDEIN